MFVLRLAARKCVLIAQRHFAVFASALVGAEAFFASVSLAAISRRCITTQVVGLTQSAAPSGLPVTFMGEVKEPQQPKRCSSQTPRAQSRLRSACETLQSKVFLTPSGHPPARGNGSSIRASDDCWLYGCDPKPLSLRQWKWQRGPEGPERVPTWIPSWIPPMSRGCSDYSPTLVSSRVHAIRASRSSSQRPRRC